MGGQKSGLAIDFPLGRDAGEGIEFGLVQQAERPLERALIAIERLAPDGELARRHQGLGRQGEQLIEPSGGHAHRAFPVGALLLSRLREDVAFGDGLEGRFVRGRLGRGADGFRTTCSAAGGAGAAELPPDSAEASGCSACILARSPAAQASIAT